MSKLITRIAPRLTLGLAIALVTATGHAQEATPSTDAPIPAGKTVPGYLIANFTIHDQAMFQKYRDAVRPISLKYKGKAIVFNPDARKVEGNPQMVTVVVEFPSLADVESFYFSPEYTEVKKLRIASTEGSIVLTQGLIPPVN
ncbi:DUF1330 domain-containing protein [Undibacterium sp. RuTC16W]|uniref:DUF1330 domain-containing protein n=1 Tax=Undibacterium sp. RuTC16W TaxID=3413048 RepID=UPI003BF1C4A8